MSLSKGQYDCPMCSGGGKLNVEVFDPNVGTKMAWTALITVIMFLGSGFLYWMTLPPAPLRPREPSAMEQCATACGPGRFKSWAEKVEHYRNSKDDWVAEQPEKCECAAVPTVCAPGQACLVPGVVPGSQVLP